MEKGSPHRLLQPIFYRLASAVPSFRADQWDELHFAKILAIEFMFADPSHSNQAL